MRRIATRTKLDILKRNNTAITFWFVGTACGSATTHQDVIADAITTLLEDSNSIAALTSIGCALIYGLRRFTRERRARGLYALIHLRWRHPVLGRCNLSDPLTVLDTNLATLNIVALATVMI